jgi:vWA-MoxR associated protein C-terminal domain/Trypsin-like peptidase domain
MGAGDQVDPKVDAWIAAIHATQDDFRPVGCGIVLDERRIMTCFHVVEEYPEPWVAFPKAQGNARFTRRGVERVVRPDAQGDISDLAILVLTEPVPPGVTAAPLRFPEPNELTGRLWWAFGFPNQDLLGSTAGGQVGDALAYGWVRLYRKSRDPIEVGFSGGGLWCPQYGAVVAVVGHAEGQSGGGRAITLSEADRLFPGEHLLGLADRQAASGAAPPAPEVAELAEWLADRPDALAIIHEVFERTPAVAPVGATIIQLLVRLHGLVQPSGEAPLLQQVRELAAQRAIGSAQAAPALDAASTDPPVGDLCLLVAFRQDRFDPDNFLLSLTLFQDGQPGQPQECGSPSGSLKEIKGLLRELVPQILDARRGLPLIEFAVPEDLLDTDFDQWPTPSRPGGPSAEDYRLGEKYPVVVRDLDRLDPDKVSVRDRDRWESRWKLLLACEGPAQGLLREVDLQEMVDLQKKRAAFMSLRATLRLPDADGNAVLALLPEREPASGKRGHAKAGRVITEALKAGFAEGMPAAIWLRHLDGRKASVTSTSADDGGDDRTYLQNALQQVEPGWPARLRDLPRRVWVLRLQAEARHRSASHPGRRLSLLWADPSRGWTPDDYQLPPPSSNGDDL